MDIFLEITVFQPNSVQNLGAFQDYTGEVWIRCTTNFPLCLPSTRNGAMTIEANLYAEFSDPVTNGWSGSMTTFCGFSQLVKKVPTPQKLPSWNLKKLMRSRDKATYGSSHIDSNRISALLAV